MFEIRRARYRAITILAAVAVTVPAAIAGAPVVAAAKPAPNHGHMYRLPAVPVHAGARPALTAAQKAAQAMAAKPLRMPSVAWPSGAASVSLTPATRTGAAAAGAKTVAGPPVAAGRLPITVASRDVSASAARSVSVGVASRDATGRAGVNGAVVTVARGDRGSSPSPVTVGLDYASFAGAYGGGWADRLTAVALPACALTTPAVAGCQKRTPIAYRNDRGAHSITVDTTATTAGTVLAFTSSPSGSVGTYTATSMSASGQWSVGGNSGSFSYSYPITIPPTIGGGAPDVALSYDSGSVDGRTSATNAQASWIGDGWDYSPGYIERSYQACSQDGMTNSADLCWAGNLVQLSLGGHQSTLVRDDSGTWKLQQDDGTKVIALTGVDNTAWSGEAWEIITPDGTQYYFGVDHFPGSSAGTATNTAWTEPVYCPNVGDGPPNLACHSSATGTNSFEPNLAWRWNLSYVVDPHKNLQTYQWNRETNYYQRGYAQGNGTGTNTVYTRGGYLSSISYGYRLPDAVAGTKPLAVINFGVSERCLTSDSFGNCSASNLSASTATNWPDVPFDQTCAAQSAPCYNYTPTYFTTKRLTSITTTVLVGSAYKPVDQYTLDQMFPAPEAGVVTPVDEVGPANPGDGTVAVMWLDSIKRTGQDTLAGGGSVSLPATTFVAMEAPNRVDGATTGAAALYRPRMDSITTQSGAQIVVSYADPQCSRVTNKLPTPDSNTTNCFPQYWTPTAGNSPVLDWFNKLQISMVTVNDLVAPQAWSEAQVTSYTFGGAAWHRDDSPLTPDNQRTWNQFRGYRTVTVTTGAASPVSVPTQTVTTYLQGMDGDHLANGSTRSASATDSLGDTILDSDWLQGQVLEVQHLLGVSGTVETKTVSGPWTFTTTATQVRANSMPSLVARMPSAVRTRDYARQHTGSFRSTETDLTYDSAGRLTKSDAKGDGTAAVPEVCTTTTYAQDTGRNMLAYPDEIRAIQGPCGTAPAAANTVSDVRSYYDSSAALGALTGAGDATTTTSIDSYGSGSPAYVTQKTTSYDGYGRITSATDADGHTTKTAYSAPAASPDTATTTNPLGWSTVATLDPARGLAIAATDVNGELTTSTYDGSGELTAVWSPLHSQAAKDPADRTFAYSYGGATKPSTVTTSALLDDGEYSTDVQIYDGSLRVVQDQRTTADGDVGRLLTDTHYNSLGRSVKTTSPYVDSAHAPATSVAQPANDSVIPEETETFYDGLGRSVRTLTVAKGVNQWSTLTAPQGTDETDVTPPQGGTATSVFTDMLGRTIANWSYHTATPTGKATDAVATTYTYTPAGKPRTISDNAGNTWQYTYDLHGRQVQLSDSGAGTSTTAYSPGGEVTSIMDGRGSRLSYTYDALGRKTAEYNTTGNVAAGGSNELAAWTYDSLAKGQPTAQIRYSNGAGDTTHTYTEATTGYTPLYQPTGTTVTIPSAEGKLASTYQTTNLYSAETSILTGIQYNAEGGLPKEAVNYTYTRTGLITSFGGTYSYLNDVTYDQLGLVHLTNFGVLGTQLSRAQQYDQPTNRLLKVTDQVQTGSAALATTTYTYSQSGTITSESTAPASGAADTQCFGYDNQSRLTAAWTDTNGTTATTATGTTPVAGIGGCVDTAPTAGKVTGGPAPYWESYGYDPLGDRTSEAVHDTSVTSTAGDVTQALTYPGNGTTPATAPDAVQTVTTTSGGTSTTSRYAYDAGGNTTTRTGQSFDYDAEGQTSSVTTGSGTTGYLYAADGSLLIQRDPAANQTILYLPYGEEIHLNTTTGVATGLRYYDQSPDGVQIQRSSTGAATYLLTDKLKTATRTVNATTLASTTRYFDPYGDPRGPQPASWPDQHGFLGQPQDPSTGLDLLGARQYDPVTGRFLSVDPLLESGDSRQMNGYSYAADNPVNLSDPTGTRALGGSGGPGDNCDWQSNCGGGSGSGTGSGSGRDVGSVNQPPASNAFDNIDGDGLVLVQETDPHFAQIQQAYLAAARNLHRQAGWSELQADLVTWFNACKSLGDGICGKGPGTFSWTISNYSNDAFAHHLSPSSPSFNPILVGSRPNGTVAALALGSIVSTRIMGRVIKLVIPGKGEVGQLPGDAFNQFANTVAYATHAQTPSNIFGPSGGPGPSLGGGVNALLMIVSNYKKITGVLRGMVGWGDTETLQMPEKDTPTESLPPGARGSGLFYPPEEW
jgi:RHS repeat-associated protein